MRGGGSLVKNRGPFVPISEQRLSDTWASSSVFNYKRSSSEAKGLV